MNLFPPSPLNGAHALVLAAGAGRRFGGRKLLAPWRGEPLICAAVRTALSTAVEQVTVVLGCDAALVRQAVETLGEVRVNFVYNESWENGIASSFLTGLSVLPSDADRVLIFLGDMPCISQDLAGRLLTAVHRGAKVALATYNGQPAHPVAVSKSVFPYLQRLRGDQGARRILAKRKDGCFSCRRSLQLFRRR